MGGGGPETRIDVRGQSSAVLQWRSAVEPSISFDSAGEELSLELEKMEEVARELRARRIEAWRPEE